MLVSVFSWLNAALQASSPAALAGSLLWGILSILLSPCHLASIPLIIGFIHGQGRISTRRAFGLSLLFSLGLFITIAAIGVITSLLGRLAGDVGAWSKYAVAGVFVIVGLNLLGILPLPFLNQPSQPVFKKRGLIAALALGLIFGLALGPCTFAFMAPVLGVAFGTAAANPGFAVSLVLAYALGHISVIVAAGTFTEVVQGYLNWNEKSGGAVLVKKICGGLVLLGGIYLAWK